MDIKRSEYVKKLLIHTKLVGIWSSKTLHGNFDIQQKLERCINNIIFEDIAWDSFSASPYLLIPTTHCIQGTIRENVLSSLGGKLRKFSLMKSLLQMKKIHQEQNNTHSILQYLFLGCALEFRECMLWNSTSGFRNTKVKVVALPLISNIM